MRVPGISGKRGLDLPTRQSAQVVQRLKSTVTNKHETQKEWHCYGYVCQSCVLQDRLRINTIHLTWFAFSRWAILICGLTSRPPPIIN